MAAPPIKRKKKNLTRLLKQQQLPTWKPMIRAKNVFSIFFGMGFSFLAIGIALFCCIPVTNKHLLDYTNCFETEGNDTHWIDLNQTCVDVIKSNNTNCYCRIKFNLTVSLDAKVFMYYKLTNFHQNHRLYAMSVDEFQLLGYLNHEPSRECAPFDYTNESGVRRPIAPCGAIANSMFNDKLELFYLNETWQKVPLLRTGIAWDADKKFKFRNPPGDLKKAFENFSKPLKWKVNIWELDLENEENNGFQNENFIIWMRTAGMPTFRKLYRRVDHDVEEYKVGLRNGSYMLKVEYNYDVSSFGGSKNMLLSTVSVLGASTTNILGIMYVTVGIVCILAGIGFLIAFNKRGLDMNVLIDAPTECNERAHL